MRTYLLKKVQYVALSNSIHVRNSSKRLTKIKSIWKFNFRLLFTSVSKAMFRNQPFYINVRLLVRTCYDVWFQCHSKNGFQLLFLTYIVHCALNCTFVFMWTYGLSNVLTNTWTRFGKPTVEQFISREHLRNVLNMAKLYLFVLAIAVEF